MNSMVIRVYSVAFIYSEHTTPRRTGDGVSGAMFIKRNWCWEGLVWCGGGLNWYIMQEKKKDSGFRSGYAL